MFKATRKPTMKLRHSLVLTSSKDVDLDQGYILVSSYYSHGTVKSMLISRFILSMNHRAAPWDSAHWSLGRVQWLFQRSNDFMSREALTLR